MAEWKYLEDEGNIVEDLPGVAFTDLPLVCADVAPQHASLIAEAPGMEMVCRGIARVFPVGGCLSGCDCFICLARAILRRIDAGRERKAADA